MTRLGVTPLGYASSDVAIRRFKYDRRPTSSDFANFIIGDEWFNSDGLEWWKMSDKTSSSATWVQIGSGTATPLDFLPDSGTSPVQANASNEITIAGGTGITTVGGTATITFNADTDVATSYVCDGGTAVPAANVLNVIGGISVTTSGSGNTITISSAGPSVLAWTEVTTTSETLVENTGYIINSGTLCTLTLPATISFGAVIEIVGKGIGGWTLEQNSGQTIHFLTQNTTTGVTGSVTPVEARAAMGIVCDTTNTDLSVRWSLGNFTVV